MEVNTEYTPFGGGWEKYRGEVHDCGGNITSRLIVLGLGEVW